MNLRAAEWINCVYFGGLIMLALFRRLPAHKLRSVVLYGAIGWGATLLTGQFLPRVLPPEVSNTLRNWVPAALILFAYHQAGMFFERADVRLQARLVDLDRRWIVPLLAPLARLRFAGALIGYLELSYLLCYLTVPAGVAALYVLDLSSAAGRYWTITLGASYVCYGMLPFLQSQPPRTVMKHELGPVFARNPVRRFNLWILGWGSIQVNTFPSAHVAASIAVGLALLSVAPWTAAVFLWVGIGITAGAVIGRYHYLADAITGVIVAVAVYFVV